MADAGVGDLHRDIVGARVDRIAATTPIDNVRLLAWARLERTPSGALFARVPNRDVD